MRTRTVLLLALLVAAPLAAPLAPAAPGVGPALRVGDEAHYSIQLTSPSVAMTAVVVVGGPESCQDGFDRVFACHEVNITHSVPVRNIFNRKLSYHLSTEHAEFVSWGSWALDGVTHQQVFAADSPLWQGYPYPAYPGTTADASRGVKVLLAGALVTSARASVSSGGPTSLAAQPGALAVDVTPTGRTVELSFGAGENATAEPPVRYVATYGTNDTLPASITVEQGGVVVATATRTSHTAGTTPISFAGYVPLDIPTHPKGVPRMGWTVAPPSRNTGFYYPFREAYLEESVTPHALLFATQHPAQYVSRAFFEETVGEVAGVETRTGRWVVTHANGTAVRTVQLLRTGPEAVHAVHADAAIEETSGVRRRLYTPVRADLPTHAIAFEDALKIAQAHVPIGPDAFMGSWQVPEFPGVSHTADGLWYWFQCGPVEGGYTDFVTFVSGVNGQVLSRIGDGSAECVPEPEAFAAASEASLLPLRDPLLE